MIRVLCCLLLFTLVGTCAAPPEKETEQEEVEEERTDYPTTGSVEQLDERLTDILDPSTKMEVLASGFDWSEGIIWVGEDDGYALFSDIPKNRIHCWNEADGLSVYLEPSGFTGDETDSPEPGSNRIMLDRQGRLLLCQHGDRRIARMNAPLDAPAADFETIVSHYDGKRLNSPNDMVLHPNGNLYFTDPPYGMAGAFDSPYKELDYQGVYRYSFTDGSLTLQTKELRSPNGIELTPDGKTLIVAQSGRDNPLYMAYDLDADGNAGPGRVLYDPSPHLPGTRGGPDGMRMHPAGYLFATGPGGVYVFHPDETLLGIIQTGQRTANCAFDHDQRHLYMNADSLLLRIPLRPL